MAFGNALLLRAGLVLCLLAALGSSKIIFNFDSFCDQDHLTGLGDFIKDGPSMLLNPSRRDVTGSIFVDSMVPVTTGFTSTFQFAIKDVSGGGGDGFAFVVQTVSDRYIGSDASNLGYGGMRQALVVEFDTYQNNDLGDPNDNHVSVHYPVGTEKIVSAGEFAFNPQKAKTNFRDGNLHTVVVSYDGTAKTLSVSIDSNADSFVWQGIDLNTIMAPVQGRAYVGFTGASGGRYESHEIRSWSFDVSGATTCLAGFQGTSCTPIASNQDCTVFTSCQSCAQAVSCCGWCNGKCNPPGSTVCTPSYECSSSGSTVLWWGIGIVIAVLVLCAIALFVYWRRTRIRRRMTDPTLLPAADAPETTTQTADSRYSQL